MPVEAEVIRAGARNTRRGAAETFTGVVFQDPVITAEAPSRLGGSVVTFTPGARTAWHSHPVGQTLFCLSGVGRICFKREKPQVRFVARINSRAQSAPRRDIYVRRTYSGRPSSSMPFSEATAMATSVVCRPPVRERSASPITRL